MSREQRDKHAAQMRRLNGNLRRKFAALRAWRRRRDAALRVA